MPPSERLVERINRNGPVNDFSTPRPVVTLEEFFEGNNDPGSIVVNLGLDGDYVAELYGVLKRIRSQPSVAGVYVEVTMHDDEEAWPYSDTVWIITSASSQEARRWLGDRFAPDDVVEGFPDHPAETVPVPTGMRVLRVWYD